MKILHVLSTPRAEGTPNLVLDWLQVEGHAQDVFVLNSQPGDLTERLRGAASWYGEEDYFSCGKRKFTSIAAGVRRVCKARRPDLIVCWPTGFANWVCLGARLAGVKNLIVHAGNPPNRSFLGDWMTRYGIWPLHMLGAKVICCSDYVRSEYRSVPFSPKRLFHVVWNCVKVESVKQRALLARELRGPGDRPTAVMVATLERHKDHETMLRAIPSIVAEVPGFRIRLVGDGSLRGELKQLSEDLKLGDAVEFLGTRSDVPELLGTADLFVLSTTPQEGLGTVMIEAMAAGLPVVASDVPACRELSQDGAYGVLVPAASPQHLARAVTDALLKFDTAQQKRSEYANNFTPARMMEQYLNIAGQRS